MSERKNSNSSLSRRDFLRLSSVLTGYLLLETFISKFPSVESSRDKENPKNLILIKDSKEEKTPIAQETLEALIGNLASLELRLTPHVSPFLQTQKEVELFIDDILPYYQNEGINPSKPELEILFDRASTKGQADCKGLVRLNLFLTSDNSEWYGQKGVFPTIIFHELSHAQGICSPNYRREEEERLRFRDEWTTQILTTEMISNVLLGKIASGSIDKTRQIFNSFLFHVRNMAQQAHLYNLLTNDMGFIEYRDFLKALPPLTDINIEIDSIPYMVRLVRSSRNELLDHLLHYGALPIRDIFYSLNSTDLKTPQHFIPLRFPNNEKRLRMDSTFKVMNNLNSILEMCIPPAPPGRNRDIYLEKI